ncbi:MAG TPA: T9SS type A sorting domain-containing protein [Flavobacteriaceae bacterium]|nr:T9SS type A sorting domain-containing protein [Flavobacteriaceae bacterium]
MKHLYAVLFCFMASFTIAQPGTETEITSINASIPYQGFEEASAHLGTGEYKIYFDNIDGILDKPIFFIEGFDPGNSRTIDLMYQSLTFGQTSENLADVVRDEGYDLIVLNFPTYTSVSDGTTLIDGGADYIQRNAFILIELMNTINAQKSGTEQNVIIGPSMGGLISRYALSYMEQNALNHDTRLYVSFDSPHLGANVPIGLQYLFNYMVNGDPAVAEVEPLVNGLLNTAAAKQMLIDHYTAHLENGSSYLQNNTLTLPLGAANYREEFQSELEALGFPQDTRNIAITNGSGSGEMTGTPGMEVINHTFDTGEQSGFNTRAIMKVNFTPYAAQTLTVCDFTGQFFFISWIDAFTYEATSQAPAFTDGIDSAPGGQFDMYAIDQGVNPLLTEFVSNLNTQYFNFIPTLSALSITDTSNWYALPNEASSPFDSVYIPENNEPHVTLTQGNVDFVLNEIFNGSLNTESFTSGTISLKNNPVAHTLTLLNTRVYKQAQVAIYNMMGRKVYSANVHLEAETSLPVNLNSGMYILHILTEDQEKTILKLVVKQ